MMKEDNVIQEKSYAFALRMVKLYKYLVEEKKEYVLAKQILKSGTSIGANAEEGIGAQSRKDFLNKITIAYKEARETHFWLRLLTDSDYLEKKLSKSLLADCEELKKNPLFHYQNDQIQTFLILNY
jgi:four helix bundle protein